MAIWMTFLVAMTWVVVRDGPPDGHSVATTAAIGAFFWAGGIGLSVWACTVRVLRVDVRDSGALDVVWRSPVRVERRRVEARDVPPAVIVDGKDSDGDPYYCCRVTLADGATLDLGRGPSSARRSRRSRPASTPPPVRRTHERHASTAAPGDGRRGRPGPRRARRHRRAVPRLRAADGGRPSPERPRPARDRARARLAGPDARRRGRHARRLAGAAARDRRARRPARLPADPPARPRSGARPRWRRSPTSRTGSPSSSAGRSATAPSSTGTSAGCSARGRSRIPRAWTPAGPPSACRRWPTGLPRRAKVRRVGAARLRQAAGRDAGLVQVGRLDRVRPPSPALAEAG